MASSEAAVGRLAEITKFVLGHPDARPDVGELKRFGLGAHAYAALPTTDEARPQLREDSVRRTVRHMAHRAAIGRLLGAWGREGIESLVFKGFYLAEFVYEMEGVRPYADVDILIDEKHSERAAQLAQLLGWRVTWSIHQPNTMFDVDSQSRTQDYYGHEAINLVHEEHGFAVDVHRRIIHNKMRWTRVQRRITNLAWKSSATVEWEGTRVHVLAPEDSILIGLVLNRCWGSDDWHLKPRDYLDFQAIVRRFGVDEAQLRRRARELGCSRTLRLFLKRCDPFQGLLRLQPPSRASRFLWGCSVTPERGHPGLERAIRGSLDAPLQVLEIARAFPSAVRALGAGATPGRTPDAARADERCRDRGSARAAAPRPMTLHEWNRLQRAVRRSLILLRRFGGSAHPTYMAALVLALRGRGFQVEWDRGQPGRLEVGGRTLVMGGVEAEPGTADRMDAVGVDRQLTASCSSPDAS